jgi:iron complex transport system ATP-binding protein
VVSVLHEVSMAMHANQIVVMREGRITHHGPAAAPQTHNALCAAFDGRIAIHPFQGQWVVLPRNPGASA